MFKKLGQVHIFAHARAPGAEASAGRRNPSVRHLAADSHRMHRQILVCRWRQVPPTGALECHWQIEPADASAADAPGPSWWISKVQRLPGHRTVAERPLLLAAA